MSLDLALSNRFRLPILIVGALLVILIGAGAYAWYDHLESGQETVAGNVTYAGERLDGANPDQVRAAISERAEEVLGREIVIETPTGEIVYTARDLGFEYRADQTEAALFAARHRGGFLDQFISWMTSLVDPVMVADQTVLDRETATSVFSRDDRLNFAQPEEPSMSLNEDGVLVAILGTEGLVGDVDDLVSQIEDLDPSKSGLTVRANSLPVAPSVSDETATGVVESLNEATGGGAAVIVNGQTRVMTPLALRRQITMNVGEGTFDPQVDLVALQTEIESLYTEPVGEGRLPTFDVRGDQITVVEPGTPPEVCCDESAAENLAQAILDGTPGPFVLGSKPETDPEVIALYDGSLVVESVSSFTTPHRCCENRVSNIQLMADIVRGYYLLPGEVLSLNNYVGPRTEEKGFLPAGAIRLGRLTPEIGGGVSQFATTIFNAAYFAGLDILDYQAHSLYFTRYPYGREATISIPAPDLVFENTTPYPVLIWTSYTSTSITVSMYSTKNIEVEQVATRSSQRSECTYVETDRERVYDDGRRTIDTFFALYRPADGIDCNGDPIPE